MPPRCPKLCECGCGEPAPIANRTRRVIGHVKGQPLRYINGHNSPRRRVPVTTVFQDPSQRVRCEPRGYQTPCWTWTGKLNGGGYGAVTDPTGVVRAVAQIRSVDESNPSLAARFGVHAAHISKIRSGRRWA